jgi:hypothetical protein
MQDVVIFRAILSILRTNGICSLGPFGTFCGHLVYICVYSCFGCCTEENLATMV